MTKTNSTTPGYTLQQAQRDIASLRGATSRNGIVLPSGFAGFRNLTTPADYTTYTVTAASLTQCTKAWNIPANDAQAGTTYRLTAIGSGTQAAGTARTLTFQASPSGLGGQVLPASFAGLSAGFELKVILEITCISTGSSGTANIVVTANTTVFTNAGTSVQGFSAAAAFNTQTANTLELGGFWSSSTGAPTFTIVQSYVERLGP